MALPYPRQPGLVVRAQVDSIVYKRGDIAILFALQTHDPDCLHLAWPPNYPQARRSGIGYIYIGKNFAPLSVHDTGNCVHELADLIDYANRQTPVLAVTLAEDLYKQKGVPTPASNLPTPPPLALHFYRVDTPRTLTNDYLKKDKDDY